MVEVGMELATSGLRVINGEEPLEEVKYMSSGPTDSWNEQGKDVRDVGKSVGCKGR